MFERCDRLGVSVLFTLIKEGGMSLSTDRDLFVNRFTGEKSAGCFTYLFLSM